MIRRKDQNGYVHEIEYDGLGRRVADEATTTVTGVDGWIVRLEASYDALDRPVSLRSLDDEYVVQNEVELTYNGFGQVTETREEHAGEVDGETLAVIYGFSDLMTDQVSRLESIEYPATGRKVYFHYDSSSGSDISRKDWILGRVTAISNGSSPTGARLADYRYQGLGRVVSRTNQVPSNDPVVQKIYDRFGRIDQLIATNGGTLNSLQYEYDLDSQVTWREESATSG